MSFIKSVHFPLILKFLGIAFSVVGFLQILPIGIALYYQEETIFAFAISAAIALFVGLLLFFSNKVDFNTRLSIRDSFMIIFLMWLFVPAAGMLPFLLGTPIESISDAFFETYAGFTTTGFTNLAHFEQLPKSIILWKSLIQWVGGMGLMIFIISLFPLVKDGEFKVFFSDVQDTSYKPLHYKVSGTARRLWYVYIIMTFLGVGGLMLAGQSWFDALCFSMSSISTGGGVPYHGDISHLSIPLKSVLAILMLVAGANYFFVFQVFRKQKTLRTDEFVSYIKIIFVVIVFLILPQLVKHGFNGEMIFESVFNSISFVSTTGFFTKNSFDSGILFIWMLLLFVMFVGSSTGSSGGGLNIYRLVVLYRSLVNFVKTIIHPNTFFATKFNKVAVPIPVLNRVYAFFILYMAVFFIGALILTSLGFTFEDAVALCSASLSNTGPAVFLINGYTELSQIHEASKITLMMLMIIGRIEIFPFLLIFSRTFWRA